MKLGIEKVVCEHLVSQLERATIVGDFIETNEYQRGIGKTSALVKFAKKYGLTIVVRDRYSLRYIEEEFGFNDVVVQSNAHGISSKVVFDEGVNHTKFLSDNKIATGFLKRY